MPIFVDEDDRRGCLPPADCLKQARPIQNRPMPFMSDRGTGEPPLMLGLSAFFALKDAVAASADHKAVVRMEAPATPERILLACEKAKADAGLH